MVNELVWMDERKNGWNDCSLYVMRWGENKGVVKDNPARLLLVE